MRYDLRHVGFEGFLDFIFDHPVANQFLQANWQSPVPVEATWYDQIDLEVKFDASRNCEYLTLLFLDPVPALHRYSPSQVEQGLWWMQHGYNDGSATDTLCNLTLPVRQRAAMINAMYYFFAGLCETGQVGEARHMWWDSLIVESFGRTGRLGDRTARDHIWNAMFETLGRILRLDDEDSRFDALHGLNHLDHPWKEFLIQDFLETHPDLDQRYRRYAEGAQRGELL